MGVYQKIPEGKMLGWTICMQNKLKPPCMDLYTIDLLWKRSCLLSMFRVTNGAFCPG
jgi:hypothetical protein